MRTEIRLLAAAATLILSACAAFAHDYKAGDLDIHHPWSKATFAGAPVASGFITITNNGKEPDRLVRISSDVAGLVQIHDMKVEDGMMKMAMMPDGVEIAPGATVELAPGGMHVMFMSIKQPFKEGEKVKAVLTFEKAGDVAVEFTVEPANKGDDAHSNHKM